MVEYSYYINDYNGSVIDNQSDFERYEKSAQKYVKSVINPNVKYNEEDLYEGICAVAEQLYENKDLKNIKSEAADGVSVTYKGDFAKSLYETLKLYIPKNILYRGFDI